MAGEKTVRKDFQAWKSGGIQGLTQRLYRGLRYPLTFRKNQRNGWKMCRKAEDASFYGTSKNIGRGVFLPLPVLIVTQPRFRI